MSRSCHDSKPQLTECRHVQYCSTVSMKRFGTFRSIAIAALLLPGLAIAAPIAGPCGLCGDGGSCHMKVSAKQVSENHSCCGEKPAENPPEPSLGSSDCGCGREAPPAVTADSSTTIDTESSQALTEENIGSTVPIETAFVCAGRPPAPPPSPPVYLFDCAFLT